MTAGMAIVTRHLSIRFGGVRAVDGIELAVPVGEIRAIIGPNGAGKTSLFNLLGGQLAPTTGRVELFGVDVTGQPAHLRSRAGVARTFQLSNLFGDLTVADNVALADIGHARRARWQVHRPLRAIPGVTERTDEVLQRFALGPVAHRRVNELAYGQQRVLEIAMAVAGRPRLLLLDEPTAGVSRHDADNLARVIAELPDDLTILLVEHDMEVAFALADRVTVMVEGRELLTDAPEVVRGHPDVITAYLGRSDDAA